MFTKTKFFVWFAVSLVQSLFIYGIPMLAFNDYCFPDGETPDLWFISTCAFFTIVHLHYIMLIIFTRNWTWWTAMWYILNYIFFNPVFIFVYDRAVSNSPMSHRIVEIAYSNGIFWLVMIITTAATILPIYFYFGI